MVSKTCQQSLVWHSLCQEESSRVRYQLPWASARWKRSCSASRATLVWSFNLGPLRGFRVFGVQSTRNRSTRAFGVSMVTEIMAGTHFPALGPRGFPNGSRNAELSSLLEPRGRQAPGTLIAFGASPS